MNHIASIHLINHYLFHLWSGSEAWVCFARTHCRQWEPQQSVQSLTTITLPICCLHVYALLASDFSLIYEETFPPFSTGKKEVWTYFISVAQMEWNLQFDANNQALNLFTRWKACTWLGQHFQGLSLHYCFSGIKNSFQGSSHHWPSACLPKQGLTTGSTLMNVSNRHM